MVARYVRSDNDAGSVMQSTAQLRVEFLRIILRAVGIDGFVSQP